MTFRFGEKNITIEELIDLIPRCGNVDFTLTGVEAMDLAIIIKKLYEDNKMIYDSEGEFVRE